MLNETKEELLEQMAAISNDLDRMGIVHLADILTECMENVAVGSAVGVPLQLKKVSNLLDNKGLFDLADEVDDLVPDILEMSAGSKKSKRVGGRLPADKAYKMTKQIEKMYACGDIDENSLEYKKAKDLKDILSSGFLLPSNMKLPKKYNNWWDYFEGQND